MDKVEAKKTLWFAYTLAVYGVVMSIIMILFYVVHYRRGLLITGEDLEFDWFSGEALFAYSWAFVFVFLAWLMSRVVYKSHLANGP